MSKAKKRSTPLKAKSPSKAAKPARPDCPVASIARQTIPLIELANGHQQLADMATDPNSKARHEEQIRHIHDQMRGNRDAASFLIPRSLEGVAFLLCSVDADAEYMADNDNKWDRQEYRRRIRRAAYGIRRYLTSRNVHINSLVGGQYLNLSDDPHEAA